MKLVTYLDHGEQRVGALLNQDRGVLDLAGGLEAIDGRRSLCLSSMLSLIGSGEAGLELARQVFETRPASAVKPVDEIRLLAPLPRPVTLRDCGLFVAHIRGHMVGDARKAAAQMSDPVAAEAHVAAAEALAQIFLDKVTFTNCTPKCISGPDEDIVKPGYTDWLDFELEFAAVIGKKGKDISREAAKEHIFGYTIFNDWGARDEQMAMMKTMLGAGKGKDFDGSKGLGPCIVTVDEIGDPYTLAMIARVNGEEWCRGSSNTAHHHFEDAIAELSRSETLLPGEVLGSATVAGGRA